MIANEAAINKTNVNSTEKENLDQTKQHVGKTFGKARVNDLVKSEGAGKIFQREQFLKKYIEARKETKLGGENNMKLRATPLAPMNKQFSAKITASSRTFSAPILKPVVGTYNTRGVTSSKEIKRRETVDGIKNASNAYHLNQKVSAKGPKSNNIPDTKQKMSKVLNVENIKTKTNPVAGVAEEKRIKNQNLTSLQNMKIMAPTKVDNTRSKLITRKDTKATNKITSSTASTGIPSNNNLKCSIVGRPAVTGTGTLKKQCTISGGTVQSAAKTGKHVSTVPKPIDCRKSNYFYPLKPNNKDYINKPNVEIKCGSSCKDECMHCKKKTGKRDIGKVVQIPANVTTSQKHLIKATNTDKTRKFLNTVEASHEIFQTPNDYKRVKSFYTIVTSTKYSPLDWTAEDMNDNISPIEPIKQQHKIALLQPPYDSFSKSGLAGQQRKFKFIRYSILESTYSTDIAMPLELQTNEDLKNDKIMEFGKRAKDKITAVPDDANNCLTPKTRTSHVQREAANPENPNNNGHVEAKSEVNVKGDAKCLPRVNLFQKQLTCETERLEAMCAAWEQYKIENLNLLTAKAGDDMINVAIGQTKLLTVKKFLQFEQLIDRCRNGLLGKGTFDDGKEDNKLVTVDDLDGFWSLVCLQIDNINSRFENLTRWRDNGWVDPDLKPVQTKVKKSGKQKPPSSTAKPAVNNALSDVIRKTKVLNQNKLKTTQPTTAENVNFSKPSQECPSNTNGKTVQNCAGAGTSRTSIIGKDKGSGENVMPQQSQERPLNSNNKKVENCAGSTQQSTAVKDKGCVQQLIAPSSTIPITRASIGFKSTKNVQLPKSQKGNELLNIASSVKDQQQSDELATNACKPKTTKTIVRAEEKSNAFNSNKITNNPNLPKNKLTGITNLPKRLNSKDCASDKNTQVTKKEPEVGTQDKNAKK
ncbi:uncharacterized protein LOC119684947 [Teleopsis dalmanni]|uniref:uncharacterized protein LOC119684947 n=1 Tax=Teleopsis dalmanni TaxID=139649 RepID=UPI0018CD640E|nr:uncharacterized protein LOC119684947 [Teleopsis dalmanni]